MTQKTIPAGTIPSLARQSIATPQRPNRPRTAPRSRHIEAHAAAWLRALRRGQQTRARP
jgi:hypothetical protein